MEEHPLLISKISEKDYLNMVYNSLHILEEDLIKHEMFDLYCNF